MESLPIDIESQVFHTEQECENYLVNMRWSNGFCCPRCEHPGAYKIESRRLLECSACKMQLSFTAGTIMHKSKLPLLIWFRAIQLHVQNELNYTPSNLSVILGINYRSARLLLQKIQFAYLKQENRILLFERMKQKGSTDTAVINEAKPTLQSPSLIKEIKQILSKQFSKRSFIGFYRDEIRYKGVSVKPMTFEKWIQIAVSVTLYPAFLRCHQLS